MEKELNLGTQISKYYKSFSGTDTLAFIMMPGSSPVVIGSLTTVSYSMFRNKKPVVNIGRTNINGVTRGARIFAGTMIFTLINQHWLNELQEQITWLAGYKELKVDELPLFDIMIVSANEYGNYASMYIYGIDFTDEAQTISVEDLFTENTFSFVARDVSNFKSGSANATSVQKNSNGQKYGEYTQRLYVLNSNNNPIFDRNSSGEKYAEFSQRYYVLDSSNISIDELAKLEYELTQSRIKIEKNNSKIYKLNRELYYSSTRVMMGNDVAEIQELYNQTKLFKLSINGVFDEKMDKATREYQSSIGADVTGIVDSRLYNELMNQTIVTGDRKGVVVNKYGAYVYNKASLNANIVDTKPYREQVLLSEFIIDDNDGYAQKWYRVSTGYVVEEDIYSSYYTGNVVEFPRVQYGDNSAYVTLVQTALAIIFPEYKGITGNYDYTTQAQVKKLQEDNGIYPSGIVDYDTWLLLQSLSGSVTNKISNDNFNITFRTLPGIYNVARDDVMASVDLFDVTVSCNNFINVKVSAICIYDDNTSETISKTYSIKDLQVISMRDLQNAFVFNPVHNKMPREINYVVYPYNKKPYKWTIMYV